MKYDINTFVGSLIEEKGLTNLDDKVIDQMYKDLVSRVENRINAIIATNIPESSRDEFEKLIDSDATDEVVQNFCSEKIPDLQNLVATDLAKFQSIYLGK